MSTQKYISASCTIGNQAVRKNGEVLFSEAHADAGSFLLAAYQHFGLNYPKFYKMDNLCKLGWLTSEILLRDSLDKSRYRAEEVGLVLSNRNSSLDADVKYWDSVQDVASPSLFVYTLPNIVIGEICIRNGFKGEGGFYITDTFDADFIARQVNYLMDNDILRACICGWVDVAGQDYRSAMFLVEQGGVGTPFDAEELKRIFDLIQPTPKEEASSPLQEDTEGCNKL